MKIKKAALLPCFTVAIMSASAWAAATPQLKFSSKVPKDQASTLLSDLAALPGISLNQADSQLYSTMGIPAASASQPAAALLSWLSDRVHIVVGEDFDPQSALTIAKSNVTYPNPVAQKNPFGSPQDDGGAEVIMSNLGTEVYSYGKQNSSILGLNIDGLGNVAVTSPRVGILQIGSGMFSQFQTDPQSGLSNMYPVLSRLATLFHEARHSDGSGTSLGFTHSICPAGHPYQGLPACDDNLNGPYTIQALLLQGMTESCASCTTNDKEALRLEYLDNFGRVLNQAPSPQIEQARQMAQMIITGCDRMKKLNLTEPEQCEQARNLLPQLQDTALDVQASNLDATPENVQ